MKTKENKAITLIALVVTIVVLLILAGISINMITGQNGILKRTQEAKEKTDSSSDLEYLQTKAYEAITNYYAVGSNEPETEYVLKSLNNSGIVADINTGSIIYNGKTYDISDIMGKTSEQKAIEAQGDVKIKQITKTTATNDDLKLFETGKIRMIIQEDTDSTNRAVIPNGFYYVTGAPSTGLVISDKLGDDDNNTKGGNQFVWVPCSGTAGVTYEKENKLATTWKGKYSERQAKYTEYSDWTDEGGNLESVRQYGGFYIARYEAGVPINASFYVDHSGGEYATNKNPSEEQIIEESEINLTVEQLKNKLIPVSKKNTQCWNEITQEKAEKVSRTMYYNNSYVKSSLVDSYAWDTVVEWISKDTSKYSNIATISTPYGNYNNNYNIDAKNTLYAIHRCDETIFKDRWTYATKYLNGEIKSGIEKVDAVTGPEKYEFSQDSYLIGHTYSIVKELATGVSNVTKTKNIYDLSGNMWEWTTEIGKHNGEPTQYGVIRAGGFSGSGINYPLSYRGGDFSTSSYYYFDLGFRVVLYIID